MVPRVLSADLFAIAPLGATADAPRSAAGDVNGIEAFPVEVEVNCGLGRYHGRIHYVVFAYFKIGMLWAKVLFDPVDVDGCWKPLTLRKSANELRSRVPPSGQ
jgi:hypothetical protein